MSERVVDIETPVGLARAVIERPRGARASLVLGHGAGGTRWSQDLLAVRDAAVAAGWAVALVEQPWRVAGRKVAPAPATLDRGWIPVLAALRGGRSGMPGPLAIGGRSAGARVACRTAAALEAQILVCLSFPLHPPGAPEKSRIDELARPVGDGRAVLVVQGERDPFGSPGEIENALIAAQSGGRARVVAVPGTHTLSRVEVVAAAVRDFLEGAVVGSGG